MHNQRPRMVNGRKPAVPPKPKSKPKDPVEVYCRIRPIKEPNDEVCAMPIGDTIVQLSPPSTAQPSKNGMVKETQYTFKHVFNVETTQKLLFDHVALPLVNDLLNRRNGLLFTYGVTGSGKTFTMTGTSQDGGILPRSLDVIFNSLGELQAHKYVFKPDKMNGFDVQSEVDAMLDRQKDVLNIINTPKVPKTPRKKENDTDSSRIPDPTKIENVEEDNTYSVFVQYVEIYNNYIYDLLEDIPMDPLKPRPPQSKILREDASHNMYIHGCTEIEVKSTDEAYDAFYRGQKRRRIAHTSLNTESSRSHSVFTIRLVQAPLDQHGEMVLQNKDAVCISQLSLVDLAGSERTIRTKNSGDRLREAGNINNSLMVLRTCIEVLRENQSQSQPKMVPYRDSKLTHLFKNYFDGEGKVRMIVCINPSLEDYDENLHVMRFAELTQEVQIARPTATKVDLGLTPGRRRMYKAVAEKLREIKIPLEPSAPPLTPLDGPPPVLVSCTYVPLFPSLELRDASDDLILPALLEFLESEKQRLNNLKDHLNNQLNFRNRLLEMEKDYTFKKQEAEDLKIKLDICNKKLKSVDERLQASDQRNELLQRQIDEGVRIKRTLEHELDEKEMLLNQGELNQFKLKTRMQDKILMERERLKRDMVKQVQKKEVEYKTKLWMNDAKLRSLREIVSDKWTPSSGGPNHQKPGTTRSEHKENKVPRVERRLRSVSPEPHTSVAVANPRHRRSRSTDEIWLDHEPPGTVELGTILQPKLKRKKSVSKLTIKDVTKDASKYVLTHQEQDMNGDVETHYYKGNVIPSAGGGAQVIFNDVETLKQTSPGSRKRSVEGQRRSRENCMEWTNTENRCATAIEGHSQIKKSRP